MAKTPYHQPVITKYTDSATTIGATTTEALAANDDRMHAVLTNDSDEVMYLGFDNAAVMNEGLRLNAAGGSYEITLHNMFHGAVNAICASGTKVLCYIEGTGT